ncbi:hypothetical protein T4A_971 [Trichinella pseudospiralis]|uniref:Uncharacterized protein n=1 Tax=Trichinella pseudospiralis TaxID=6337 RepID=A0A0V1DM57_TRIPS|nr:hypothetical protein T4A_971 [Trichinella pseudospiralis]
MADSDLHCFICRLVMVFGLRDSVCAYEIFMTSSAIAFS